MSQKIKRESDTMKKSIIEGIIYPIREKNFQIIKNRKEPCYIKYLPHIKSKSPKTLKKGHFLLFYLSAKNKSLGGYAKIKSSTFQNPSDIEMKYMDRIQMDKKDFYEYTLDRMDKKLLFLELDDVIVFNKPVKLEYPITMGGKYITSGELSNIINKI